MNITAISFSYSDDSMNHRGLLLMNRYLNFKHIIKMNLPMCNSNKPDGDIPNSVETLDRKLKESDVLVFAITLCEIVKRRMAKAVFNVFIRLI